MVARVDTVLREELGLADGLADKNVYVLDPCCGTGSYLVETLKKIHQTLKQHGEDALLASDLKEAAQKRVFGFELLPAPFVVAHLQLGLLLQNLGAPLPEKGDDRVGVYLTNALTGWELRDQPPLVWPEMEAERVGSGRVKREPPILVVLGNPPYNGFAGVGVEEERDLVVAYKTTKRAPAPQGQGLNDLYVRFYRMAEHRIAEMTGSGVVCFISNYSWLDGLSFTGMREGYLEKFDHIWVDCLNGDKYKTGKVTPEGKPDPSVFSTEWNHEGIQVGTAIGLLVRGRPSKSSTAIRFRHLWGKTKREQLLESLSENTQSLYEDIKPALELGLPFTPTQVSHDYSSWPSLTDLIAVSFPGVKTSRDDLVIDIDRSRLLDRMQAYFNPEFSHEEMRRLTPDAMQDTRNFSAERTRNTLRERGFLSQNVVQYLYRPFDLRWLYWEPGTDLLDRKREDYFPQVFSENMWVEARQKQTMEHFDRGYFVYAF